MTYLMYTASVFSGVSCSVCLRADISSVSLPRQRKMASPNSTSPSTDSTPHLEVIDRVKNIPIIQSAIEKTESTYSYVKDSHYIINWALNYAEAGLHCATATAAPLTAPIAKKFEGQISAADHKLCEGLDIVEKKIPMMKQPPQQMYDAAKAVMNSSLQPTIEKLYAAKASATQQASTLKEISMAKANEILSTQYGSLAVQGVDNTSVVVNRLLDHYFPAVEGEVAAPSPVSADENTVLHVMQTIGQLSTKMVNRVYHSVAAQLKTINKDDVATYISTMVSILHLIYFLNIGQKQIDNKEAA